jgi:TPR repeat protein
MSKILYVLQENFAVQEYDKGREKVDEILSELEQFSDRYAFSLLKFFILQDENFEYCTVTQKQRLLEIEKKIVDEFASFGKFYEMTGEEEFSRKLELAEISNIPELYCEVAKSYYFGKGVPMNRRKAAEYFQKAANLGSKQAHVRLGVMYYFGKGLPRNFFAAFKWFSKAALLGSTTAKLMLAKMHEAGKGTRRSIKEAIRLYFFAAKKENAEASYSLGIKYLIGEGVPKKSAKAEKYLRKAAGKGHKKAADVLKERFG